MEIKEQMSLEDKTFSRDDIRSVKEIMREYSLIIEMLVNEIKRLINLEIKLLKRSLQTENKLLEAIKILSTKIDDLNPQETQMSLWELKRSIDLIIKKN